MKKLLKYKRMFIYEDMFSKFQKLQRLESMDYDTKIYKMPRIYKKAIDLLYEKHGLMYSELGGSEEFKKLILNYEQYLTGSKMDDCMVFCGSGVSSLVGPVVEAILALPENKQRKDIILFSPDYTLFHSVVELANGNPVTVYSKRKNNYLPTIEEISTHLNNRTAAVLFSNPNNPTGKSFSKKWIKKIISLSEKNNFFIISDEIYSEMLYDQKKFIHIGKIKKNYKNYVKLFGSSKDRPGMTGMRMGYCIGDSRLYEKIHDIQMVRNFSGNILSEFIFSIDISLRYYALSKIKSSDLSCFSKEDINDYYSTIEKNRIIQQQGIDMVISELKKNSNVVDIILPDGGNSVFFKYYKKLSPMDLLYEFINKGLAIYPTDSFNMDPLINGSWIRICVTHEKKFLKKCISKI